MQLFEKELMYGNFPELIKNKKKTAVITPVRSNVVAAAIMNKIEHPELYYMTKRIVDVGDSFKLDIIGDDGKRIDIYICDVVLKPVCDVNANELTEMGLEVPKDDENFKPCELYKKTIAEIEGARLKDIDYVYVIRFTDEEGWKKRTWKK